MGVLSCLRGAGIGVFWSKLNKFVEVLRDKVSFGRQCSEQFLTGGGSPRPPLWSGVDMVRPAKAGVSVADSIVWMGEDTDGWTLSVPCPVCPEASWLAGFFLWIQENRIRRWIR